MSKDIIGSGIGPLQSEVGYFDVVIIHAAKESEVPWMKLTDANSSELLSLAWHLRMLALRIRPHIHMIIVLSIYFIFSPCLCFQHCGKARRRIEFHARFEGRSMDIVHVWVVPSMILHSSQPLQCLEFHELQALY